MATCHIPAGLILHRTAAVLLLLSTGCGLLNSTHSEVREVVVFEDIDNVVLVKDAALIEDAKLQGNLLKMRVSFSGGGREHAFELFGWLGWDLSIPPGGHLFLSHDARGDSCEALIHAELTFDLGPLKSAWKDNFKYSGPVRIGIREPGEAEEVFTITAEIE